MQMKTLALVAPLTLLTAATVSAAATDVKPPDLVDVQAATCAQFAKAMAYAKPPAKATEKQKAFAVLAQSGDDTLGKLLTAVGQWLSGQASAMHLTVIAAADTYQETILDPQDVVDLVPDVFRHRLVLTYEALAEGVSADEVIHRVLRKIPAPEKPLETHVKVAAQA